MRILAVILLVSALLQGGRSDDPVCCQSPSCGGCTCRSSGYKFSEKEKESWMKFLESASKDDKNENPETYKDSPKPSTTTKGDDRPCKKEDPHNEPASPSNTASVLPALDCMMCKMAHC
ncbi:hypothetical protein GDO81_028043 [Engystomops pustulosus]|uniref:Uncharacterized protein n=1 Tax=Engystomops pustulosus TaxID=76066 RepID=A0AAV6Z0I1_ENGPU|nr:hypothetical protein GDO81_028043 [Engystomops pustulosus]